MKELVGWFVERGDLAIARRTEYVAVSCRLKFLSASGQNMLFPNMHAHSGKDIRGSDRPPS